MCGCVCVYVAFYGCVSVLWYIAKSQLERRPQNRTRLSCKQARTRNEKRGNVAKQKLTKKKEENKIWSKQNQAQEAARNQEKPAELRVLNNTVKRRRSRNLLQSNRLKQFLWLICLWVDSAPKLQYVSNSCNAVIHNAVKLPLRRRRRRFRFLPRCRCHSWLIKRMCIAFPSQSVTVGWHFIHSL